MKRALERRRLSSKQRLVISEITAFCENVVSDGILIRTLKVMNKKQEAISFLSLSIQPSKLCNGLHQSDSSDFVNSCTFYIASQMAINFLSISTMQASDDWTPLQAPGQLPPCNTLVSCPVTKLLSVAPLQASDHLPPLLISSSFPLASLF